MPRYFFDIHAASLSEWDDDGIEASDVSEAIAHAKHIIAAVIDDSSRLGRDRHAVVIVRDRLGNQVATVTGVAGSEIRVILPR